MREYKRSLIAFEWPVLQDAYHLFRRKSYCCWFILWKINKLKRKYRGLFIRTCDCTPRDPVHPAYQVSSEPSWPVWRNVVTLAYCTRLRRFVLSWFDSLSLCCMQTPFSKFHRKCHLMENKFLTRNIFILSIKHANSTRENIWLAILGDNVRKKIFLYRWTALI